MFGIFTCCLLVVVVVVVVVVVYLLLLLLLLLFLLLYNHHHPTFCIMMCHANAFSMSIVHRDLVKTWHQFSSKWLPSIGPS